MKIHATQELSHALEIARQIDYLGGDSTVNGKEAETSDDSKSMLEIDLKAEVDTVKNYKERIRQAEVAGEFALSEKLRQIIAQEQDYEIYSKRCTWYEITCSMVLVETKARTINRDYSNLFLFKR